jgi:hypothetical protein
MNTVVLIIHDIHFPYSLFEEAIAYAKEHESAFRSIFLTNEIIRLDSNPIFADTENDFPGNMIFISNTQRVIAQHLRFLQQRANACHLPFKSVILTSPVLHQVVEQIKDADKVFMDVSDDDFFQNWSFSRRELLRRVPQMLTHRDQKSLGSPLNVPVTKSESVSE